MDKSALRRTARAARALLAAQCPGYAAHVVRCWERAGLFLPPHAVVAGYAAMTSGADREADPSVLMQYLAGRGHRLVLPQVRGKGTALVFRRWQPGAPLVAGVFGTREPPDSAPEEIPDVLLVPLLAFDRQGYRLGYGGGYYDRTLMKLRASRRPLAIGLAFDGQEVAAVPHDDFDQRLDMILTEAALRSLGCSGASGSGEMPNC